MTKLRAVCYLRGSAGDLAEQRRTTAALVDDRNWQLVRTYLDRHGAARKDFALMLSEVHEGMFDIVVAHRASSICASRKELMYFAGTLYVLRLHLILVADGLDSFTPHGRAMMQFAASVAMYHRNSQS